MQNEARHMQAVRGASEISFRLQAAPELTLFGGRPQGPLLWQRSAFRSFLFDRGTASTKARRSTSGQRARLPRHLAVIPMQDVHTYLRRFTSRTSAFTVVRLVSESASTVLPWTPLLATSVDRCARRQRMQILARRATRSPHLIAGSDNGARPCFPASAPRQLVRRALPPGCCFRLARFACMRRRHYSNGRPSAKAWIAGCACRRVPRIAILTGISPGSQARGGRGRYNPLSLRVRGGVDLARTSQQRSLLLQPLAHAQARRLPERASAATPPATSPAHYRLNLLRPRPIQDGHLLCPRSLALASSSLAASTRRRLPAHTTLPPLRNIAGPPRARTPPEHPRAFLLSRTHEPRRLLPPGAHPLRTRPAQSLARRHV